VVPEEPAYGDRRPGAVQVGHQGATDLRVCGKLAQMKPAHPAGRNVPNQERPSGKASAGQERNQLVGGACRPVVSGQSVVMRRPPVPKT